MLLTAQVDGFRGGNGHPCRCAEHHLRCIQFGELFARAVLPCYLFVLGFKLCLRGLLDAAFVGFVVNRGLIVCLMTAVCAL